MEGQYGGGATVSVVDIINNYFNNCHFQFIPFKHSMMLNVNEY